ncbi:MAG: hypothetical protein ACRDQX_13620, partial [Pseudonocardiaceae bacterium]
MSSTTVPSTTVPSTTAPSTTVPPARVRSRPSASAVPEDKRAVPGDHRWLILMIVAIAQLMVVLDATIVNIALPSAQHALGFPNSDRQWIV